MFVSFPSSQNQKILSAGSIFKATKCNFPAKATPPVTGHALTLMYPVMESSLHPKGVQSFFFFFLAPFAEEFPLGGGITCVRTSPSFTAWNNIESF